jgi:hypothetical protein
MIHLTLNAGDSRESPRREVNHTVIILLTPLVHLGEGAVPGFPYDVSISRTARNAVLTISARADSPAGAQPIQTCGLAQEDDEAIREGLCRLLDPRWSRGPQVRKSEALPCSPKPRPNGSSLRSCGPWPRSGRPICPRRATC